MAQEDLDELVLIRPHRRKGQKHRESINVLGSLVESGIAFSFTYDQTPEITITLHDPLWVLVTHPFFDRNADDRFDAIDVMLDGVWWRLVGVSPDGALLSLKFEPRDIVQLRNKFGHMTVSRNKLTRAQFQRRLVKSVRDGAIGFYSRELTDIQPTATPESEKQSTIDEAARKDDQSQSGLSGGPKDFSSNQQKFAEACAAESGLDVRVIAAWMYHEFGGATKTTRGNYNFMSVGFTDSGDTGQSKQSVFDDPVTAGRYTGQFIKGETHPKAAQGIIDITKTADKGIEEQVHAIIDSPWASSHYRHDYSGFIKLAQSFEASGDGSASIGVSVPVSYQFSVKRDEDYWTALRRLADEVVWRLFWHRGVIYFMDDYQLLRGVPQWHCNAVSGSEVIGLPSFDWDERGNFVHEMRLRVRMPRNFLAPGDVVNVDEAGPGNGRWIVAEVSGTWFDSVLDVRLAAPQAPKKEPAHDERNVDIGTGDEQLSGNGSAAIEKWIEISGKNMPYVWGGGHNSQFAPDSGGYDCSGFIGAGLHAAGLIDRPMTSGEMAKIGKPGRGKEFTIYANSEHVFVIFENGAGGKYKRADTSPQGGETQRGPHVREHTRSTAGFTPRHFEGH